MSTCNNCNQTPCGCQSNNVYHSTTPDPYSQQAMHQPVYAQNNCGIGVIPTLPATESCSYGPAQPIDYGVFQALDSCGKIVPYARVTVTYVASGQLVPLYYRPIASPKYAQNNPVTTNEKGRASIFFFSQGHDVRVVVECIGSDGNPVDTIDSFVQYAATNADNFDLSNLQDVECLTITNPRVLIYDKDDCNKPYAFMDLRFAMIEANIRAGVPAGSFTDVKNYYACLGCGDWEDGVIVYGDCNLDGCVKLYKYKAACDQECPPNPCDDEFDDNGESSCWINVNRNCLEYEICSLPIVDPVPDDPLFLVRYNDGAECKVAAADPIDLFKELFDGQSLDGTFDPFTIPSDSAAIVQLVDGGAAPPNDEPKIITVNKAGDYLVTCKARIESATPMTTGRLRVGINSDTVGSIDLAGWDSDSGGQEGIRWISGSRVFRNLSPGDTINLFGQAATVGDASPIDFRLITLSAQLSVV